MVKKDYTREELLSICEKSFVPQNLWGDRDSAEAQKQLGQCYVWLKDGCDFKILTKTNNKNFITDDQTIWVEIQAKGFEHFDYQGGMDTETFYLPTERRLKRKGDWY